MNASLKKQLAIACMALFLQQAAAISDSTKDLIAIGSGITAGALAGYIASNSTDNTLLIALSAAGIGGGSWWLLDYILSHFTPSARLQEATKLIAEVTASAEELNRFTSKLDTLNTAEKLINNVITECSSDSSAHALLQQAKLLLREIRDLRYIIKIKQYERNLLDCSSFLSNVENNILVSRDLTDEIELLTAVNLFSNTTWPLLKSKEYLFKKRIELESFEGILEDLINDLFDDTKQEFLVDKASNFIPRIKALKNRLQQKMSLILSHTKYAQELASYEQFQEAERQREFLLEKAREEARLKERELREKARLKERELELKQNFKHSQNKKDRELKEKLALNPTNAPAQVIIKA